MRYYAMGAGLQEMFSPFDNIHCLEQRILARRVILRGGQYIALQYGTIVKIPIKWP